MDYKLIYNNIIDRSKNREIVGYVESHHIIPKSLGGSDEKSNLVELTAREHFLCHYLLTKMYDKSTVEYYKMLNAFIRMKCSNILQNRYFNSHLYENAKISFSKIQSIKQTGEGNSQYGTIWIHNLDLKVSKKIPKNKFADWAFKGWQRGRVVIFDKTILDKTKTISTPKCNKCGVTHCDRPDVCNKHYMINTLVNIFGLDKESFGSTRFYAEFDRVVEKIYNEYHIDGLSTIDLSIKYGISTQRIDSVFKSLNISHRSKSDARKNFKNKK